MARGNPNPSPSTRFAPGNEIGKLGGRPKASRDRLGSRFVLDLAEDFEKHGRKAIEAARLDDPVGYLRLVSNLLPKEVQITKPLDALSDDELDDYIGRIRDMAPVLGSA